MKIEHIKKLPNGKYKIVLDDNLKLITYDDVIIKNHLLYNKELDLDIINNINKDTVYYDIYNKTIKYIALRMRSNKEIDTYLAKYNLSDKEFDEIKSNLIRIGLIDDKAFAKAYTFDRFNLSNDGPNKIYDDLCEHLIDKDYIDEAISLLDKEELLAKLERIIKKKINSNHKYSNYHLKQKIITELIGLWYDKDLIVEIFDSQELESNNILTGTYDKLYEKLSRKYSDKELYYQIKSKLYQKGFDINEINELLNNIE